VWNSGSRIKNIAKFEGVENKALSSTLGLKGREERGGLEKNAHWSDP
jgi:hypothetical protein